MIPAAYEALAEELKGIGIPCAENAWATTPTGPYITYALEFEADSDYGDDRKTARAWEGSVDLWAEDKRGGDYAPAIEAALAERCDGCWRCEVPGHWERESGLWHFEWVFQV